MSVVKALVRSGGFGPCASRYFSLFSGTQSFMAKLEKSEQKVHALLVLQYLPWDLSILGKFCAIAMAERDVFGMLSAKDKLDGTNYPLWSYMMRHVLVDKGFWGIVDGTQLH